MRLDIDDFEFEAELMSVTPVGFRLPKRFSWSRNRVRPFVVDRNIHIVQISYDHSTIQRATAKEARGENLRSVCAGGRRAIPAILSASR